VLEHQPPVVRILTLMLFLAPLGLLLGAPFPIALQLLGRIAPTVIPWVWSINAVACVLGSVGAAYGAIAWGLSTVLGLGAGIYVVAAGWALYMLKHTPRHIEGANASPIAGV
jgi:hypothetical protein